MNLRREVLSGTIAQVLRFVIGFVGTVVMAIILGPESFGGVALVVTLVYFLDQPIEGWAIAAKQRIASGAQSPEIAFGGFLLATTVWLVVIGIGVAMTAGQIQSFTGLEIGPPFVLLVAVTTSVLAGLRSLLAGRGQVGAANWYQTATALTTTPLQVGLVVIGYGALGMLGGLVAGTGVLLPFAVRRVTPRLSHPTRAELLSQWRYARKVIIQIVFGRVYARVDLFLLGTLLSPSSVGHYQVAWKLVLPTAVVTGVAAGGLMTRVASNTGRGESPVDEIEGVLSFASVLAIPAFFGTAVLGRPLLIALFGPAYAPAATLLVGLAAFRVLSTQSVPLVQTLNGLDAVGQTIPIKALGLVINVILGVVLVDRYGAIGVVVATILAQMLVYALLVNAVRSELGAFSPVTLPFVAQLVAGTSMAVGLLALPLDLEGPWTVAVAVGLGAVGYGAILLGLSAGTRQIALATIDDLTS